MRPRTPGVLLLLLGTGTVGAAAAATDAEPAPVPMERVEVTATRVPEDPQVVPASVTIVDGDDLRARGAYDLREALALAAGIDVSPGGDGGPAGFVPEIQGLREADAFLLVVDGIPWGGAFDPDTVSLNLEDVERIEIVRGPAPVMYGATSFTGVIHVIRRGPETKGGVLRVSGGTRSTGSAHVALSLPAFGGLESRLDVGAGKRGYRDPRTSVTTGDLAWNGSVAAAGGMLRVGASVAYRDQDPASPHPRQGRALSAAVPIDANHNPSDSRLDPQRYTVGASWARPTGRVHWTTTVSAARVLERAVRGFLSDPGSDPAPATGFRRSVGRTEVFLDAHLDMSPVKGLEIVAGIDHLHGDGSAEGTIHPYTVALDGSGAPDLASVAASSEAAIHDRRDFSGLYGWAAWTPRPELRLEAGARLNRTDESRRTSSFEYATTTAESGTDRLTIWRGSGSIGFTGTPWRRGSDAISLYAGWRSAFKPAAVDFGLAAEGEILDPETSTTWEAGAKFRLASGAVELRTSFFQADLENLVVPQTVGGLPARVNAGSERLRGAEVELDAQAMAGLWVRAAYSLHDARFLDYVRDFDGLPTQLSGKRQEMTPRDLASVGIVWAPPRGFQAHGDVRYVGFRWLNKRNTAPADPYTTWSAGIGWRLRTLEFRLDGENLNDRRDPVAESEIGDAQYYRLPGRRVDLSVRWTF